MNSPTLVFEYSPLLLLICAAAGACYALLLYKRPGPWGKRLNYVLTGLRFVLITILAALLVSPALKQVKNRTEKPVMVVAIDNSLSIAATVDSVQRKNYLHQLTDLSQKLANRGFDIAYRTFDNKINNIEAVKFDHQSSDLSSLLEQVSFDYEGRNLEGVVLATDGIYNEGFSPTYRDYGYKIVTIGLGDTIPKPDISIVSLLYNKVSYQGNKFPLIVQFLQKGYDGGTAIVNVIKDGDTLQSGKVQMAGNNQLNEIKFQLDADEKGFQRYAVSIDVKEGELSQSNNIKQAYIEIIEGKENIAMIASAPHPDIKAFKFAIESNSNYSFDSYILSVPKDVEKLRGENKKYDLVIYHELPSASSRYDNLISKFQDEDIPFLTIYGTSTSTLKYNKFNGLLTLDAMRNEYDQVKGAFNPSFSNFSLSDELKNTFNELPPITVPFGRVRLEGGATVLLYQQVGSIATRKPLIVLNDVASPKRATILSNEIWKWRITSYVKNENHAVFNELVTKIVQLLSSKVDKRKFRFYPVKNEFNSAERVIFDAEVYNDLYERIYGNKIDITVTNEDGKVNNYSYITNENNTRYSITGLQEGVYNYTASTIVQGQKQTVNGEFVVQKQQLEDIKLTADFKLLRNLANNSGGAFFTPNERGKIQQFIAGSGPTGIIHSSEVYLPFINLKWLFFLLLALISVEWLIRKYSGSY